MTVDRKWVERNLGFDPISTPPPPATFAFQRAVKPEKSGGFTARNHRLRLGIACRLAVLVLHYCDWVIAIYRRSMAAAACAQDRGKTEAPQ